MVRRWYGASPAFMRQSAAEAETHNQNPMATSQSSPNSRPIRMEAWPVFLGISSEKQVSSR